jgi:hypothetical protein
LPGDQRRLRSFAEVRAFSPAGRKFGLAPAAGAPILLTMKRTLLALIGLALLAPLHAADPKKPEPFEDALREAVKEYRAGNHDKARAALEQATTILNQQQSGKVANAFPAPPAGWTASDIERSEIPAFLGGGRTVKITYTEKTGRKEIALEVISGSSFAKLLMGLTANDQIAESQGFKVRRIGGDSALLKESATGGELNLPVDDDTLVKLTGKGGAGEKDLIALAREVDRRALKQVK